MICNNCGANVDDQYSICPRCGNALNAQPQVQQPVYQPQAQPQVQQPEYQPQPQVQQPEYQPQPEYQNYYTNVTPQQTPTDNGTTSILVMGILSLAFVWVPFLGFIFGIIAKTKANNYKQAMGRLPGKAKAGKIMAIISLIVNLFWTIALIVMLIVGGGVLAGLASY